MPRVRSFEDWMRRVDFAVQRMVGLSVLDLPDMPFRDWWEDDMGPGAAAARTVREAM